MKKDDKTFESAKNFYVNKRESPEEIECKLSVSARQVYRWVVRFKWDEEREKKVKEEANLARQASVIYDLKAIIKDIKDFVALLKSKMLDAEPGTVAELAQAADRLINTAANVQALDKMEDEAKTTEPLRIAK